MDTRFSKFAPSQEGDSSEKRYEALNKLEGADSLLDLLGKVKEKMESKDAAPPKKVQEKPSNNAALRLFSFGTMDNVLLASHLLNKMYSGSNTLYKDPAENIFILALTKSEHTDNDFNRICNMLTEYGTMEKASSAELAFLEEHCEVMIEHDAIKKLAVV